MDRIALLACRLAVVLFAVVVSGCEPVEPPDALACDPESLQGVTVETLAEVCGAPLFIERSADGTEERWVYREAWASILTDTPFLCVAISDGRVEAVLNRRDECTFEPE